MRSEDREYINNDPRGQIQPPSRQAVNTQDTVANIARTQLDSIYDNQHGTAPQAASSQPETTQDLPTAYKRSHKAAHNVHDAQWREYHSAWQQYYQKYYEQYYVGAVKQVHQAYTAQTNKFPQPPSDEGEKESSQDGTISRKEAVDELRSQLLSKVRRTGKKVRSSRHFVPLAAAVAVLVLFSFLQYNRVIIANVKAYVTPGEIDPQNIVVDPNTSTQVGREPLLIIPKINVNVPVMYNVTPDQPSQLKAMENGVAYFGIPGANSKPGQVGNTVISGHSSNDFIDGGNYKFVFALLERLKPGDIFYLHYEGIRYTYSITRTKVVAPTDVSALVYPTTKPEVTLITCTPLGTALNRLLVTAEQVSPNPATAASAPADTNPAEAVIPGNSPTFLERIFGN